MSHRNPGFAALHPSGTGFEPAGTAPARHRPGLATAIRSGGMSPFSSAPPQRYRSAHGGDGGKDGAAVSDMTSSAPGVPTPLDDAALTIVVRAAQAGDDDAFRAVYRCLQPGLLRYLRTLVGTDAEDVASEAWLQIARDLQHFTGDGDAFRGWSATIARRRAQDHLRKLRRRPVPTATDAALTDLASTQNTAGEAMRALETDAAIALIAALPREQAEAVMLRVVVGLDAETTGKILGKRAGAVRTAVYRGLKRLAGQIDEATGGGWSETAGVTDRSRPTMRVTK